MILFRCPSCRGWLQHATPGDKITCAGCNSKVTVPSGSSKDTRLVADRTELIAEPALIGQPPTDEPPDAEPESKQTPGWVYLAAGAAPMLLVATVVAMYFGFRENPKPKPQANVPTNSSPKDNVIRTGDRCRLESPDGGTTLFASDPEAVDEMLRFSATNNNEGVTLLMVQGRIVLCDNGTMVEILGDEGPEFFKVRILSGNHEGRKGVSPRFMVKK